MMASRVASAASTFSRSAMRSLRQQPTIMRSYAAESASADVKGPVYVVFGATGGIGSCLAQRLFQQNGSTVVLVGRDQARLDALKTQLGDGTGRTVLGMVADAQDAKQVDAVLGHAAEAYGRVDGVANCVGSIVLKPAHQTSESDFEQCIRVNLFTAFNVVKSSVKRMMTQPGGGSIVLCSSAVAKHGQPNHEAVAAAKAGVVGLMLSSAATYAPKGIRVNCVAPGLTRTPLSARITANAGALKASEAMHALKRIGEADEVAAALEFLMNPTNSFITAQVLAVDGGLSSVRAQ